jgi:hypothetical protein
MEQAVAQFTTRLQKEWLPTFCGDPKRQKDSNYSIEGFRPESIKLSPEDAYDFMRALDSGVVTDSGGGRYRAPRSKSFEQLFWTGRKTKIPQTLTLWIEPVITIAIVARLHLDCGWPKEAIGTQSAKNWAFDLFVVKPPSETEYIAGEVKKSQKEVDRMIDYMRTSCAERLDSRHAYKGPQRNAHRKWLALRDCRAPLFWAVGPGKYSRLFSVTYATDGPSSLDELSTLDLLRPR